MPGCPTCKSPHIIVVLSARPRAFCTACGTRWVQEGSYQREIKPSATGRILALGDLSVERMDAETLALGAD
jgi:transposase-like protein